MECNRDEAARAKEIADTKLANQDIPGAKKFALKAQCLYPQLEGLSQLISTIDVFISASNKVAGEVDWYGVLGVTPSADDDTVKKQYKKLALVLHPDKNKSPNADGAFKLICEAWSLLSDKSKRLAYNQRRSPRGFTTTQNSRPLVPQQQQSNGVYGHNARSSSTTKPHVPPPTSVPRAPLSVPRQPAPPVPRPTQQRSDTFWTICHGCKMHYEYMRKYINHTLLCQNCHQAFLASEAPAPFKAAASNSTNRQHRQQQNSNNNQAPPPAGRNAQNSNSNSKSNNHASASSSSFPTGKNAQNLNSHAPKSSGPRPSMAHPVKPPTSRQYMQSQTRVDPAISERAASVVQQAQERMKREHFASHSSAAAGGLFKKARFDDYTHNRTEQILRKSGFEPGFSSFYNRPNNNNSTRELTPLETKNMLVDKARKAILQKLNERKSKDVNSEKKKLSVVGGKEAKNGNGKRKAVIGGSRQSSLGGTDDSSDSSSGVVLKPVRVKPNKPDVTEDDDDPVVQSMDVPDSDFHDFDQDRAETCFGENEVWAGYDDHDGMPRFYAIINKVISRKPFKLKIGWINSKTNTEFSSTLDWIKSGFPKTCGEFRIGRYEINKSINVFSHKVQWSKGPRGIIQIYPKKGDVWALYRHWASDWNNETTPVEVKHKYNMVVVLEDYLQEQGSVSVAPLVKVPGFKTIFRPHPDQDKVIRIPKEEMFRFSHQVPHYLFTGEESINAPKGCLELDPAATPLELLEVGTDKNEDIPEAAAAAAAKDDGKVVNDDMVTKIEAEDS